MLIFDLKKSKFDFDLNGQKDHITLRLICDKIQHFVE